MSFQSKLTESRNENNTNKQFIESTYWCLQAASEVHHRHIRNRYTECHTSQLAIQFRYDFPNSLSCSSGSWYHILIRSATITPFLKRHKNKLLTPYSNKHLILPNWITLESNMVLDNKSIDHKLKKLLIVSLILLKIMYHWKCIGNSKNNMQTDAAHMPNLDH